MRRRRLFCPARCHAQALGTATEADPGGALGPQAEPGRAVETRPLAGFVVPRSVGVAGLLVRRFLPARERGTGVAGLTYTSPDSETPAARLRASDDDVLFATGTLLLAGSAVARLLHTPFVQRQLGARFHVRVGLANSLKHPGVRVGVRF